MKTKRLLTGLISALAVLVFAVTSCEIEKEDSLSDEVLQFSEDDALATTIFNDALNDAENALEDFDLKSTGAIVCKSVDHTWQGDTLVITITYNGECQVEFNGNLHWKSGKIIINRYGGRHYEAGATRTMRFENYYVDSVKVEGKHSMVSNGYNADSSSVTFDITIEGGKLTFPDGNYITRTAEKTRTMYMDDNRVIDHFLENGTANGRNIFGDEYSRTMNDLWTEPGCPFIMSGTIIIEIEGKEPVIIDYGDGSCDSNASVTRNGKTEDIQLRLRYRNRYRNRTSQ